MILGENKECLVKLIPLIGGFLKSELQLSLHQDKIIIRKFNQGIDFLGYLVLPHYRVLQTKTKNRIFKKIKMRRKDLIAGFVSEKSFNQSLQSYLGVLKHCKGYKIIGKILFLIK